eukprot:8277122-Pyramimonas_sp.AAC.2
MDTLYHVLADVAEARLSISRHQQLKPPGRRGRLPKLTWVNAIDSDTRRREGGLPVAVQGSQ